MRIPFGSSDEIEKETKPNRSAIGSSAFEDTFSSWATSEWGSKHQCGEFLFSTAGIYSQHNSDRTDCADETEWRPICSAPFDRDVELAVIDGHGENTLVFPCRRTFGAWIDVKTKHRIVFDPTHWRDWSHGR
jgi:hypothetical protein